MDDLHAFMTGTEKKYQQQLQTQPDQQQSQKQQASEKSDLRERIEKEESRDRMDAKQFWQSLLNADLLEWDHRSHLKSGYIAEHKQVVDKYKSPGYKL
jgi:hypothetical protein